MLKSPKALPLAAVTLALLTGCGSTAGPAQETEAPTASPSTTATASSLASTAPSTGESTPTALPSASPAETTAEPSAPAPTVAESTAAPSVPATHPAPTGTVVTMEPSPTAGPATGSAAPKVQPTSAAGVAICDYGQLYIAATVSDGAGAAGSRYITLTFTNTGDKPCTMSGYPAVHYVDAAGQQVGADAAHASEWSASGVVLPAGDSTTATLRETRAQLFGETCQGVPAAGYSVQAPGSSQALVLNFPAEACSDTDTSQLSVGAVGAQP